MPNRKCWVSNLLIFLLCGSTGYVSCPVLGDNKLTFVFHHPKRVGDRAGRHYDNINNQFGPTRLPISNVHWTFLAKVWPETVYSYRSAGHGLAGYRRDEYPYLFGYKETQKMRHLFNIFTFSNRKYAFTIDPRTLNHIRP
jgi:hypothetical protein